MRYFRTLLPPRQAPKNITNLKEIRERIIQFTLVAVIILGIFALIANLPLAISRAEWAYVAFYLFAFMIVLIMFLVRRIPYTIKALSIISIFFVLGFTDVLESGLSGDGRIFLIISVLLATIFLGNTAGFISLFVSFASFAGIGIGMTTGKIPLPPVSIMANSGNAGDWISGTIILASMISLGLMALIITINGLDRSLSRQSNLSLALESQSTQLEKTVAHRTLDLEYRLGELRTASQISRLISNNLDPQSIMEQMANLLLDRFGLYYVGIFLTD